MPARIDRSDGVNEASAFVKFITVADRNLFISYKLAIYCSKHKQKQLSHVRLQFFWRGGEEFR
ncbi:hypothetical protein SAMN05660816_05632 [Niastella yeongjuensis]|nr:hypothetical protein SAMN05660816_05632 [Niastella yeongjuensis]